MSDSRSTVPSVRRPPEIPIPGDLMLRPADGPIAPPGWTSYKAGVSTVWWKVCVQGDQSRTYPPETMFIFNPNIDPAEGTAARGAGQSGDTTDGGER